ncbi:hypothetical protein ACS3MD_006494, partial [Pseudomonas aeruginosa]
ESRLHETLADVIRRLVLVFNDQQFHRMSHEIAAAQKNSRSRCTHSSTSISNLLVASFHEHDTNIT